MEDPINTRIVMAVAEAKGVDPLDLPRLHDCIDPDALEAVVGDDGIGSDENDLELRFSYAGHQIRVKAGGDVSVGQLADPA